MMRSEYEVGNKMKMKSSSLIAIMIICVCSGCTRPKDIHGSFVGKRYVNGYFGFEVEIPKDWLIANSSSPQTDTVTNYISLTPSLRSDGQRVHAIMQKLATVQDLLWMFPPGQASNTTSRITFSAQDVSKVDPSPSAQDFGYPLFIFYSHKSFATGLVFTASTNICGRKFSRLDLERREFGITCYQTYYFYRHGDYMLIIIVSARTKSEQNEFNRLVKELRFR